MVTNKKWMLTVMFVLLGAVVQAACQQGAVPGTRVVPVTAEVPTSVVETEPWECSPNPDEACVFAREGVTLTVPWQGYEVRAQELRLSTLGELPSPGQSSALRPVRLLFHFRVIDSGTEEIVEEFDPPLELQAEYTEEDVNNADGMSNLTLGFWVDKNHETGELAELPTTLEGGETGGIGIAEIDS